MKKTAFDINSIPVPETVALEESVLRGLINSPEAIDDARKMLSGDMFTGNAAKVWDVICELSLFGQPVNVESITASKKVPLSYLAAQYIGKDFDRISEMDLLTRVAALRDACDKRKIYAKMVSVLSEISSEKSSSQILEDLQAFAATTAALNEQVESKSIGKACNELSDTLTKMEADAAKGKSTKTPTSLPLLDWATQGGFDKGELTIVAARPGVGKTAFSLQMAKTAATAGIPVTYYSLEMMAQQLARRSMLSTRLITAKGIKVAGPDDTVDWPSFEAATKELEGLPYYFEDSVYNLDEILRHIRNSHKQGKCDIAFVDYLGIIDIPERYGKDQYARITAATRKIKQMAMQLHIPIVLLSQLNRASAAERRPPELYDLRDSGSIEQDADIVLMLDGHVDESGNKTGEVDCYIRKQRQGIGSMKIPMKADDTYTIFYQTEKQ